MSKKWTDIGTLRTREKDGKKISYLVISDDVKILKGKYNKDTGQVEGYEEVDLGDYRTIQLQKSELSLDSLLSKGYIDEDEYNKRKEQLEKRNIRYNVTIPPSN